jgi:type II secretory pathway pseudopilin PulG
MKSRKRPFTLLEVMVAFTLLLIAAGALSLKMHHMVQEKKFQSQISRLKERFSACQKLAIAMQTDWEGVLKKEGENWVFETHCFDGRKETNLPPLLLDLSVQVFLNDKPVSNIHIDFYSSGQILPKGELRFVKDKTRISQNF